MNGSPPRSAAAFKFNGGRRSSSAFRNDDVPCRGDLLKCLALQETRSDASWHYCISDRIGLPALDATFMRHNFDEEGGKISSLHIATPIAVRLSTFNAVAL
jgi:hypothetical protein